MIVFFSCCNCFSQNFNWKINYIGVMSGGTLFHGDICPGTSCLEPSLSLSIFSKYVFSKHYSIRPRLNFFRLQGDDAKGSRPERNLNFRSDNVSFVTDFIYDFLPYSKNRSLSNKFRPYIFAGVGFLWFNPKTLYKGNWINLQPLKTEGNNYSRFTLTSAIGSGLSLKLSNRFNLGVELSLNITTTDYLDDVSDRYVDISSLNGLSKTLADRSNEISIIPKDTNDGIHWAEGSLRGNNFKFWDVFSTFSLNAEFYISRKKVKCH